MIKKMIEKIKSKCCELNKLKFFGCITIAFILINIVVTILYSHLPILFDDGLFSEETFYSSFITNMWNSFIDFLFLTVLVGLFSLIRDNKEAINKQYSEIDNCRYWDEPEAAYKLRARISTLQKYGVKEINVSCCYMNKIILKDIILENSKLNAAKMEEINFRNARFTSCDFRSANLKAANLIGARFKNCSFINGFFEQSNLKGAVFEDCSLENVKFDEANLKNVTFKNCNLNKASFQDSILDKTNFENSYNLDIEKVIFAKNIDDVKISSDLLQIVEQNYAEKKARFHAWPKAQ